MHKYLVSLLFLTACRGDKIPIDGTPNWAEAGRYAIDMENDCNIAEKSVGISGCAFTRGQLYGNLIFPPIWTGELTLISTYCSNIKTQANSTDNNIFKIAEMYTSSIGQNCSFEIQRKVVDSRVQADAIMKGRFFIKILPDNYLYRPMKMEVKNREFSGVSWYQSHPEEIYLVVKPSGNAGTVTVYCAGDKVQEKSYTTNHVIIPFSDNKTCDYELAAVNSDTNKVDLGTFIREVYKPTISIALPQVTIDRKNITFQFNDLDITGKNPVVVAVKIDETLCVATNWCRVLSNKDRYTVKAFTPGGRYLHAVYSLSERRWIEEGY